MQGGKILPLTVETSHRKRSEVHRARFKEIFDITTSSQLLILAIILYPRAVDASLALAAFTSICIGARFWRVRWAGSLFLAGGIVGYLVAMTFFVHWFKIPAIVDCGWIAFFSFAANRLGRFIGRFGRSERWLNHIMGDPPRAA